MTPVTRSEAKNSLKFANLPTETLQLIFGWFCLHCRGKDQLIPPYTNLYGTQQRDKPSWYSLERHTLFSLCLVSRRFCGIAQAILYHEFVLGYGDSWLSMIYVWNGRLTSFMRVVTQRQDLAALVKRIYIHPYLLEFIDNKEAQATLRNAAHALRIKPSGDLVTMLLAALPNLEHCSLQVRTFPIDSVSLSDLYAAGISRLPFKTIDISLHASSRQSCYHLLRLDMRALTIFKLSTCLETLNLHMCGGIRRRDLFPFLPNLKTLRITYSRLSEQDLEGLLSSCNSLRTFVYEATGHPMQNIYRCPMLDGSDHFQPFNAVKYLSRHCATLKSLHLDLRLRDLSTRTDGRNTFSFQGFTALEHLFFNPSELYRRPLADSPADSQLLVQLLPPSIISLHLAGPISHALPRLVKGLLSLVDSVSQGKFPSLKQVRCDAEQRPDNKYTMSAIFAAAGISFSYNSWPRSEATLKDSDTQLLSPSSELHTFYNYDDEYLEPMLLPLEEDYEDL
ncbi:uncharacterized protein ATNIH1004_011476 [Aspergillus tanneri]|uniref:Leucine-rich repeat domain-containing protein n=1 Tax=Aspergillus tanneri TaxID=1220188 RepID=A0A5M9M707_9EURO|nr:uncharacterized protein ATNIH1004_011476 [Aspergillus tanneri]KAA8642531.1 hypothetical protein ATNIH1004_011476 [Aspergillus tanneri]